MTAARVNMTIDQGSDFVTQITWLDQNSVPLPIVAPIRMEIRSVVDSQLVTALQVGTAPDDDAYDIVYNTENGMLQISISAQKTLEMFPGLYRYDLYVGYQTTEMAGKTTRPVVRRHRLIEGQIEIRGRVTRNV